MIWGPPSLLSNGYRSLFLLEVKRSGPEATTAAVKNKLGCVCILPNVFMKWCLITKKENLHFYPYMFNKWPSRLRHEISSSARTLGSWVRIPLEAWMYVCTPYVFVLSCVGRCLEMIVRNTNRITKRLSAD
jgi:hypothetical protein